MENPHTHLHEKVVGFQFSQKIDVRDPYTRKKEQKHIKPFMVNNSVNLFEKGKIILDGSDKTMITELEEYRVKAITSSGMPQYTDENEHAIDAMNLCLLLFALHYDSLLRKIYSVKAVFIPGVGEKRDDDIKSRAIGKEEEEHPFVQVIHSSHKESVVTITPVSRGRNNRRNNIFKRRSF